MRAHRRPRHTERRTQQHAYTGPERRRVNVGPPPPTQHSFLDHLATVADLYLLPGAIAILLLVDLGYGLNWALSPSSELASPSYDAAKLVAPMLVHGVLFITAALTCTAVLLADASPWWRGYALAIAGGLWAFWAVLFGYAAAGPGVSWSGPITALGFAAFHWLAGFAVAHRNRG